MKTHDIEANLDTVIMSHSIEQRFAYRVYSYYLGSSPWIHSGPGDKDRGTYTPNLLDLNAFS